jgi:alanine racemase
MALTLTVDAAAWQAHQAQIVHDHPGLVPVVKGNGYGFGRQRLVRAAAAMGCTEVAVGTVYELAGLALGSLRAMVLTPALTQDVSKGLDATLTVGSDHHVGALRGLGWRGPVVVKLASSMRRYGVTGDDLPPLLDAVDAAGCHVVGFGLHPPLDGTADEHAAEVEAWLPRLPAAPPVYTSHIDGPAWTALRDRHRDRDLRLRLGTTLWLGDKSFLRLSADVVDVRAVHAGEVAGYRRVRVPANGWLVMVSAGTAHGVRPLDDGRSPFHFARQRLALLEPPHMHTSMLHVPVGRPCPAPGDTVDVQRPLTQTLPDRIIER